MMNINFSRQRKRKSLNFTFKNLQKFSTRTPKSKKIFWKPKFHKRHQQQSDKVKVNE